MNIESLCTRHIVSLDGSESLQRAAQLMREHHVGTIVVTEDGPKAEHVRGIVTDRDLAIEVLARGGDVSLVPLSVLAAGPPLGLRADAGIEQAARAMQEAGVRRLLVHDDEGRLVGLLSLDDLLPALSATLSALASVAGRGAENEAARRAPRTTPLPPRPALRVPAMGTAGWQAARDLGARRSAALT